VSTLALLGGEPVRTRPFPAYRVIGDEEKAAVAAVMDSGVLSRYLGCWHADFMGGPQVQAFEAEWAAEFRARHAVAVNSATSGLYAAVGAAGVGPGDEVIVSPYTMMASATAAVVFNAVPVFADINPATYTLSPEAIRARLTPRTKAIVVVHLFGQAADMDGIMAIADEHGLVVIEDCAQAPFATYRGRPVGTLGHMGVFSFNYHKHIHTGEGGVVTTNDDHFADRLRLIRNHGEAVVRGKGETDLVNMVGFNFRMGEIEAAIARCQLRKGPDLVAARQANVATLEANLAGVPGITLPEVATGNTHVYYVHALRYDERATDVPRALFVAALKAELPATEGRESEGTVIGEGYVRPLYLEPMYQQQVAYGSVGCPFRCPHYAGQAEYGEGLCPECENVHATLITHEMMRPPMAKADLADVAAAFHKVADNLPALRDRQRLRVACPIMVRFVFAAQDPGAANLLLPVAILAGRRGYGVDFLARGPAVQIWERAGVGVGAVRLSATALRHRLERLVPQMLVTGTGFSGFERLVWDVARDAGIPSFAGVDAWTDPRRRFVDPDGTESQPDAIGVPDTPFARSLAAEPWCRSRLHVTGQPHLQSMVRRLRALRRGRPANDPPVLTFFSEPLAADHSGEEPVGFETEAVADALVAGLASAGPLRLRIRPHPREDVDRWRRWIGAIRPPPGLAIELDDVNNDGTEDVFLADVDGAVAMTTMVLVESALAGIPALSLQPGRRRVLNPKLDMTPGVEVVTEPAAVADAVTAFVSGLGASVHAAPVADPVIARAAERFLEAVEEETRNSKGS